MTQLEEWQLKDIADALRLAANRLHSSDRKTCLDRMIMHSWNMVVDALNDVPLETTSNNGIMYRMKVGQTPKLKEW